ncbi:MAG: hypothetical protein NC388_08980 [Clostridium sp.]|nr:hypothetical protein [Clostridium sp.]
MKKKNYIKPESEIVKVQLESMLAASIGVDNTPGDGLEGSSLDDKADWNIWND